VGRSVSYRKYAAECRSIAEAMRKGELRSRLLNIAAEWEALADAADKRANAYTEPERDYIAACHP
jgi:hypothetical protein